MVFPVVMYRCESRTIKKAECQRIDAFELWCWRRFLRVPWTARRSNQSILREINSEYSLEELMLKLQSFSHLMWRADSLGKTLMLGNIEGRRRKGWQRMRWLDGIIDLTDMSLSKPREIVKGREAWCVHVVTKSQTQVSDWIATAKNYIRLRSHLALKLSNCFLWNEEAIKIMNMFYLLGKQLLRFHFVALCSRQMDIAHQQFCCSPF